MHKTVNRLKNVTLLTMVFRPDKESYYPHQISKKKSLCRSAFSVQNRYNVEE